MLERKISTCTEFALASGCLSTLFQIVKHVPIGPTNLFFRNEKTFAGVEKKNSVRVRWKESDGTFQSAHERLTAKRRSNEILALHKSASKTESLKRKLLKWVYSKGKKKEKKKELRKIGQLRPSEVLATDSDPLEESTENNVDKEGQDRELDEAIEICQLYANDEEEENASNWDSESGESYSEEMLRYLVHIATPEGVRFFLAALRSGTTICEFSQSRLCRDVFGEMCYYRLSRYP
ncbi:hypothetical protein ACROYT_G015410 [Oculina patagonica]